MKLLLLVTNSYMANCIKVSTSQQHGLEWSYTDSKWYGDASLKLNWSLTGASSTYSHRSMCQSHVWSLGFHARFWAQYGSPSGSC